MKLLHTADWHLGDRLKGIDRTDDLQRAVEQVAGICQRESVDVLLIAGDLLSELARPDSLPASLAHLSRTFRPFLLGGGTIVAIAGNHDNEVHCETLRRAFQLAAPNEARPGDLLDTGRFYLVTRPVHFSLPDRHGGAVQFACLPYPTSHRYLDRRTTGTYSTFVERCEQLRTAFVANLRRLRQRMNRHQPAILMTHINALATPDAPSRGRLTDDLVIDDPALMSPWTYVALGHLHAPGIVRGRHHVRYSGSIERLSIAEKDQQKGVQLVTVTQDGRLSSVRLLPLHATLFYDVLIEDPRQQIPLLHQQYRHASTALVRCHVRYRAGEDNLHEILADIARIFPRCYERSWTEVCKRPSWERGRGEGKVKLTPHSGTAPALFNSLECPAASDSHLSRRQLVLTYLAEQLIDDVDREALMQQAAKLLEEWS